MSRKAIATLVEKSLPKPLFEFTPKQVNSLKEISAVVLGVIAIAGMATVSVVAPNALKLLKYLPNKRYSKGYYDKDKRGKRKISRSIYYLKTQGYVKLIPHGKDFVMKLTQKGLKKVRLISLQNLKFIKQKTWNKKWWFILADIPVEYKSQINSLRQKIKELGVYTLQKSVWVYPFDPREELAFLAKYHGIEKYITTLEASKLDPEDEKKLKRHFKSLI